MVQYICIDRIRNKYGQVIQYCLMDRSRQLFHVDGKIIKKCIKEGSIEVLNLTLSSDNRLILNAEVTDFNYNKQTSKPNQTLYITRELLQLLRAEFGTESLYFEVNGNIKRACEKALLLGLKVVKINDTTVAISNEKQLRVMTSHQRIKINANNVNGLFSNLDFDEIHFDNVDTSELTDMSFFFKGCNARYIDFEHLDTSNVRSMTGAFQGCNNLEDMPFEKLNTSKVERMNRMFADMDKDELNLSKLDTSNVMDMSRMFQNASIRKLTVTGMDTRKVKDMTQMFNGFNTYDLDLSSLKTPILEIMDSMFFEAKVHSIKLGFNTSRVSDMNYLFANMESTSILDVSKIDFRKATNVDGLFNNSRIDTLITGNMQLVSARGSKATFARCRILKADINMSMPNVYDLYMMFYDGSIMDLKIKLFAPNLGDARSMFQEFQTYELDLSKSNLGHPSKKDQMFYKIVTTKRNIGKFEELVG